MFPETTGQLVADIAHVYRQQRNLAEAAVRQINDEQFFRTLDPESNSVAIIMKHVGGNLRSRWTDFLTTDGEKPDRDRDGEFITSGSDREEIMRTWNDGWQALEATLESLSAEHLQQNVTIRGVPHTVAQALLRNLGHTAHHAGQIVYLAKTLASANWQTLSIPRAQTPVAAANYWT